MKLSRIAQFKVGSASLVLGLALVASPAFAQAAGDDECVESAENKCDIVVTGSIFSRTDTETPSPVTTVTAEEIDQRGISTIQDALQTLTANNGPALTNSFSANGAFAAGASAVSLRGLSTNSTLVLFDGLRAAYYPLADDGSRNFVDLNTIPDDIVDRIEVLRDGASSSYGADAIAGVVNIITKREFQGIGGRVEAGVSQDGNAQQYRASLTAGFGDLDEQGFNAYISGFYYNTAEVKNRDLPGVFATDDQTSLSFDGNTGPNNVVNALVGAGGHLLSGAGNYLVRPYAAADTLLTTALGRWQNLNTNCGAGVSQTLTVAQQGAGNPSTLCAYDFTKLYGTVSPAVERFGFSVRATGDLGAGSEGYFEANFLQSTVSYDGFPSAVSANGPVGILNRRFSSSTNPGPTNDPSSRILSLPVFVCPERVNCATSVNRRLNPNNPFAAAGQIARIIGRDQNVLQYNETRNRAFRAALGVRGDISDRVTYDVSATAMHVDLLRTRKGYIRIQNLLDVIADGSYNFINPSQNTQAVEDYLRPDSIAHASSDQYQLQGVVAADTIDLPGGPLRIGGGVSVRYEAVNAPSANDDYSGATQRYFVLNAFGTVGSRTIYSAFAEVEAPILDILTVNASGRYDDYSSGQSNFSPKIGVKFVPIPQVALRATFSKGFRIPSFGEANALPTTGFVTNNASLFNNTYLAQYGCTVATFAACPVYIRNGSYGQTTLASPNLQPEKSRSFTAGIVIEPKRNLSFTVDYYNIRKTGVITTPSNAPALLAYYTGQPIPAGYTVIADSPDVNNPLATPRVAFVQAQLINADISQVSGIDVGASIKFDVSEDLSIRSSLDASYILKLTTTFPGGLVERYDGTLGNFNLTAGSGTPKLKGSWLNSFSYRQAELNVTTNFYGGYDLSAQDQGTGYKDCGLSSGYTPCRVGNYVTVDLGARFKVNEDFTFYVNVQNLLNALPDVDHVTYGAHLYNPVQGGNGILGRQFRAGVRFKL